MAIGIGTDFKIYQDQINGAAFETVMQFIDAFGPPSRNAITLINEAMRGDFRYESFFQEGDDVNRRDPDDVTDLVDEALTQDEDISVKLHRGKSKALTRNQWLRIGKDPEMFARLYGQMLARKMMKDQLNTGITAAAAALSGVATLVHDASAGLLTHVALNKGLSKFGDQAGSIVAWIIHSTPWHDLVGGAITTPLLEVGGVAVNMGVTGTLGRPAIITDSPGLVIAGSPDNYVTLGLVIDAIRLQESEGLYTADQEVTGKKNIVRRLQSEWAYNLSVRGFKYRVAAGENPDGTAVGSSGNWVQNVTDRKSTAGVYILSQ